MSDHAKITHDLKEAVGSDLPSIEEVLAAVDKQGIKSFSGGEESEEASSESEEKIIHKAEDEGESEEESEESTEEEEEQSSDEGADDDGEDDEEDGESEEEPEQKASSREYVEFLQRKRELERRQQEMQGSVSKEKAEIEQKMAELKKLQEQVTQQKPKSPMDALTQFGWSYEDVTKQQLAGWEEPEVDPVDQKLQPIQKELAETREQLQQALTKLNEREAKERDSEYKQAYSETISAIKGVVDQNTEQYDYISTIGQEALDTVNNLILHYYTEKGIMLDITQACDIVEKDYEELYHNRLAKSKKLQKVLGASKSQDSSKNAAEKDGSKSKKRKTLTNKGGKPATVKPKLDEMPAHKAQQEMAKMLIFHDD